MKRILCIVGCMDAGGAETFLMKLYRSLDRADYQMDFYVLAGKEGLYDEEIRRLGGKIYQGVPKSKNLFKFYKNLRNTVVNNNYKYILRSSEHALAALDLMFCKVLGAKKVIYRSSSTNVYGGKGESFLHKLFAVLPQKIPDVKIAPSAAAAEFMFGKKCVKQGGVLILKNGLEQKKYGFCAKVRERMRFKSGVKDEFVIGHIGRFNRVKNHSFIIELFEQFLEINPNARLWLVGDGELRQSIEETVVKKKLEGKVKFWGIRQDVPDLLMAMDCLVLPSLFEGMPNVVIEAQATGLSCVVSDSVTKEAGITGLVRFAALSQMPLWIKALEEIRETRVERSFMAEEVCNKGYDIFQIRDKFINAVFDS